MREGFQIDWTHLDVAFLCDAVCEQAYSMAQNLDPNSDGRGVLQFKTGLMSVIKVLFIFLICKYGSNVTLFDHMCKCILNLWL